MVTTGSEWVFTNIIYDAVTKRSGVVLSTRHIINLESGKEALQDEEVKPILSILVCERQ